MIDLRPVGYVIGLLVAALGATMLIPTGVDLAQGNEHWPVFLESAIVTTLTGGLIGPPLAGWLAAPTTETGAVRITPAVPGRPPASTPPDRGSRPVPTGRRRGRRG